MEECYRWKKVSLPILEEQQFDFVELICNDLCQEVNYQESSQTYSVVTEGIVKEL